MGNSCSRHRPPGGARVLLGASPSQASRKAAVSPSHRLTAGRSHRAGGGIFFFDVDEGWEGRSCYFVSFHLGYSRT